MKHIGPRAALAAAVCLAVSGCSSLSDPFRDTGTRIDYKRAESGNSLELPPDLTSPTLQGDLVVPELGEALASEYAEQAGRRAAPGSEQVLPQSQEIRILRDADQRWIALSAPVETVWPRLRDFWREFGFELKVEEPQIGIMETDWAENRADIPEDFVRGMIGKVFPNAYSSPTRDKFRARLERVDGNRAEIYLTHYGMEQVAIGENDIRWQPRATDPELVTEMLNRMVVFLGAREEQAEAMQQQAEKKAESRRARLVQEGGTALLVNESFARSWRRVGLALDKLGFIVEDRNRAAGIYYVRHAEQLDGSVKSKGWFSRLFSSKDDAGTLGKRYEVHLADEGEATRVTVQGAEGEAATAEEGKLLLDRLHSELL